MPRLGLFFLAAVLGASVLFGLGVIARPAHAHAIFAVAALPLMLGAIQHFVPVLTRSGAPASALAGLPWLAAGAGALAFSVQAGWLPRPLLLVAALLVGVAAAATLAWVVRRIRRCLGAPHAGVRWYAAALAMLLFGMAAVFGMLFDPAHYPAWRAVHLHVNLLGWIGLTALGTVPVLLPTHLQKNDPHAARRLGRLLWPAVFGVALVAAGAGLGRPGLAAAGALALAAGPAAHLAAWSRHYGRTAATSGVAASLGLATVGLLLLLLAGALHGFGALAGAPLVGAFIFGFLLPLVLGALAQLLPVWRFPGPDSAARCACQGALARHAGWRALACLAAASLHLAGSDLAVVPALAALLDFAVRALARKERAGGV